LDLKNLNPFISDQRWSRSRTAGVKQNFWLAKFLTLRHVRMHRVIFYTSNTLKQLKN